jgi:polyisoprenoid-binding protein YceI
MNKAILIKIQFNYVRGIGLIHIHNKEHRITTIGKKMQRLLEYCYYTFVLKKLRFFSVTTYSKVVFTSKNVKSTIAKPAPLLVRSS